MPYAPSNLPDRPARSVVTERAAPRILATNVTGAASAAVLGRVVRLAGRAMDLAGRVVDRRLLPGRDRRRADDLVNQAVLLGLLRPHEEVAVHVAGDPVDVLAAVERDDLLQPLLQPEDLLRSDLDVRRRALEAAGRLVDHHRRVRQREPL